MQTQRNPLHQLASKVLEGEIPLAKGKETVYSADFQMRVEEKHCKAALDFVESIIKDEPDEAFVLSELTLACLLGIAGDEVLLAKAYLINGSILLKRGETQDAGRNISIAKSIFQNNRMADMVSRCNDLEAMILVTSSSKSNSSNTYQGFEDVTRDEMKYDKTSISRTNRIINVATQVLSGNLTHEKAFEQVNSREFLKDINEDNIKEAVLFSRSLVEGNIEAALILSDINLICAKNKEIPKGLSANILYTHAMILLSHEQKEEALRFLFAAKDNCESGGFARMAAECDVRIGDIYGSTGQFNQALDYLISGRIIFKKLGEEESIAECDLSIAKAYMNLSQYEQAIKYYESALAAFNKLGKNENVLKLKGELGTVYAILGKKEQALRFFMDARDSYQNGGRRDIVAGLEELMGRTYKELGDLSNAIKLLKAATNHFREEGMEEDTQQCLVALADLYEETNDMEKASECYKSAKNILKDEGKQNEASYYEMKLENIASIEGNEELNNNPIYKLWKDVENCYVEQKTGVKWVQSKAFLESVTKKHIMDIIEVCHLIMEKDPGAALSLLNLTLVSAENIKCDEETIARVRLNYGVNLYKLEQYDLALECLLKTWKIFDDNSLEEGLALTELYLGNITHKTKHYDESIEYFTSAMRYYQNHNKVELVADCHAKLGDIFQKREEMAKALCHLEISRAIYEKAGREKQRAICDLGIGGTHEELGNYGEALEFYQSARKTFKNYEMDDSVVLCDMDMGDINRNLGEFGKAFEQYQSAGAIASKIGRRDLIALCNMCMASISEHFNKYENALKLFESAREIFIEEHNEDDLANCDVRIGNIWLRYDELGRALKSYKSAKAHFIGRGMERDAVMCDIGIANCLGRKGKYESSLKIFKKCREYCEKKGLTYDIMLCDYSIAVRYGYIGQLDLAIEMLESLLEKQGNIQEEKWRTLSTLGDFYNRKGKIEKTKYYYGEAIKIIENIRDSLPVGELRIGYLEHSCDVYYDIIKLCVNQKDYVSALEYIEQLKSRNLAEMLSNRIVTPKYLDKEEAREYQRLRIKIVEYRARIVSIRHQDQVESLKLEIGQMESRLDELDRRFRERDVGFKPDPKKQFSFGDIRRLVKHKETALIELFPMEDKTVVFVVVGQKDLAETTIIVKDFNGKHLFECISKMIEKRQGFEIGYDGSQKAVDSIEDWNDYLESVLKELYQKIFLRIRKHLLGIANIIFVPFSGFHLLPLHAMFEENGKERKYVMDDYLVTYSPSAKILFQKTQGGRKRGEQNSVVIAFSNPTDTNRLLFSWDEVREIERLYPGCRIIPKATKRDVISFAREANIFHYSGHADFQSLILHSEEDFNKTQAYSVEDIFSSLDMPSVDLVTLSACDTGVTKVNATDEYIGLVSGMISAGADTVISSLWCVQDQSTSLLMRKLYECIKKGYGKAQALREAQCWLRDPQNRDEQFKLLSLYPSEVGHGFNLDFARLYHWAGFICSGVN